VVIPGDCSANSRWFFDCYCFGLFNLGLDMVARIVLVFVVCFFICSILFEVIR
jgi:hypothetical protein